MRVRTIGYFWGRGRKANKNTLPKNIYEKHNQEIAECLMKRHRGARKRKKYENSN